MASLRRVKLVLDSVRGFPSKASPSSILGLDHCPFLTQTHSSMVQGGTTMLTAIRPGTPSRVVLGGGSGTDDRRRWWVTSVYFGNFETVPYTKWTQLILFSTERERRLGEAWFVEIKAWLEGKILPATHLESVRVRLIANDFVTALQRGLGRERVWDDVVGLEGHNVVDSETGHLDGSSWEALVVDDPKVNTFSSCAGKIIVFTGLLEHLNTDAEIATVLAHEIHRVEKITTWLWFPIIELVLYPFHQRLEFEADYKGLMLMASTGYDPRAAPNFFEMAAMITLGSELLDHLSVYISTHPPGKKRAQVLAQPQVMKEALAIYRDTIAGRGAHYVSLGDF